MKSISGKQFCKILEKRGWVLLRIKGSHHIYLNPFSGEKLVIPVHKNDDLKLGLLKSLMKIASVIEEDL
jgi:predicted RNA binding protein YcfA (HicA-like mRNA interferase family)